METNATTSLDVLTHNRNSMCGRLSALGRVEHEGKAAWGYARLYCKSWKCPRCAGPKALELRRRIAAKAREHDLNRFLTLTLDPKVVPEGEAVRYLNRTWAKFRTYLKRRFGKPVSFIRVIEETKAGVPHLHVLVNRYIGQGWISDSWSRLGGGRIVHIERVADLERVSWYLGKYLTKEMLLTCPRKTRRVTTSRDIKLVVPGEGDPWKLIWTPLEILVKRVDGETLSEKWDEEERLKFFSSERNPWIESGIDLEKFH